MSTVVEQPNLVPGELLQPLLNERWALGWRHFAVCLWFAILFVYLSYIPLFHSDIWGHVHYGRWILDHRALPTEDPIMPLAEGMAVIDNAWLAQVLFAAIERWGGAAAMSVVFAVTVLATQLLYTRVFFRLSGSITVALTAMALSFFVGFSRHAIIRPEIFGGLLFATLFWLMLHVEPWRSRVSVRGNAVSGRRDAMPRWMWIALPLLFCVWANVHGSFAVGLLVLACHTVGHFIEIALRKRSLLAPLGDREFQCLAIWTELSVVATLINPYGLDLLISTAHFGGNPNLRDVLEWTPLAFIHLEGIAFAVSVVVLMLVFRHSRRRVSVVESLLLLAFAASLAPAVRMIGWYAPVFAWVITHHLSEVWSRWRSNSIGLHSANGASDVPSTKRPSFAFTLLSGLVIWIAFALSPISQPLLSSKQRPKELVYSRDTPHGVSHYLLAKKPESLVFGPQWWGDWLAWSGPAGMNVFMTTNLHLAPARVWRDYLLVARGQAGWEQTLDRYSVGVVVVHKKLQPALTRSVRRSPQWRISYEDHLALVAERVPNL